MNPGTEIPLDKPESQVYYYLLRADSSHCSGTQAEATWAEPLRLAAQQRQTNSSDAGDPRWKGEFLPSCLPVSSSQSTAFSEAVTWEAGPPRGQEEEE